jgi:FlaA1/EpsC-like NDP-sugar epimerase
MRKRSVIKTIVFMFADVIFLMCSWLFAVYLASYLYRNHDPLLYTMLEYSYLWALYCIAAFWLTGVYRSLWQHISVGMIIRLMCAVAVSNFAVYCTLKPITMVWQNPAIGMLSVFFMLSLSGGIRVFDYIRRTVIDWWQRVRGKALPEQSQPIRVLMVGAGESASTLLANLNKHIPGNRPRRVLALVDNNPHKHGYYLHGIPVCGDNSLIPTLCNKYGIEEILVAIPSISNHDIQDIVKHTPMRRCKVRVLQPFAKQATQPQEALKDLDIGDLLGRAEVLFESREVRELINSATILVTGGGGSIGSEICRQLLQFSPAKIVIFDISENCAYNLRQEMLTLYGHEQCDNLEIRIGSVLDSRRVNEVLDEFKPSVIFHAAAFKHVPLMEECPRLAVENNVMGTRTIGLCAIRHSVKRFVLISTDKAVNPANVMGASKRMAELIIKSLNDYNSTEFVAVRFGNVLGSNGSVIPLFQRQIEMGGPVTVTHPEVIRYFMTIPEASRLVIQAGAIAKGGEIFVLDMGSPVKIIDLAESMIRMAGLIPGTDIDIEVTGLRPGEKLYEELLLDDEGIEKTINNKIYVASSVNVPASLEREMADDISNSDDTMALIRKYVPEFKGELDCTVTL